MTTWREDRLDVREQSEWESASIPGSVHEPYHDIHDVPDGIDPGKPVAVIGGSAQRSAVAASLLQAFGGRHVIHVVGGGSVLAVPVLVHVLGQTVPEATTASLVSWVPGAVPAGITHARAGRVCWRHAGSFTAAAVPGIALGPLLLAGFALVMLAAAPRDLAQGRRQRARARRTLGADRQLPSAAAAGRPLAGVAVAAYPLASVTLLGGPPDAA